MSHTHEVSWAAGFFDGEGFINIQKRSHPKYTGYYLRIGINHVAPEPVIEMQRLFGGTVVKQTKEQVQGNRKPRHRWVTGTKNAADALKQMLPYMKNKNRVSALALDFQQTVKDEYKRLGVPEQVQRQLIELKVEIMRLNSLD